MMDCKATSDEQKIKELIITNEVLANQIKERIAPLLGIEVHYTKLSTYFPYLFPEPELEQEDNGLALYKAQMVDYAWKHNHRKRGDE